MPTELSNPEFDFTSARDWQKVPTSDPSRLVLTCPAAGTTLTLTMEAMAIPPEKFEEVARQVLQVRKETHRKGVQGAIPAGEKVELVFGDERVAAHPTGQAWEASYMGGQAGKNVFAFFGYVTSRKIVQLYVESALPLADKQGEIFQEVIQGFKFMIP